MSTRCSLFVALLVVTSVADARPKSTRRAKPECSQVIAKNVAFKDLKLVGVVAQGTRRKVLMMDTTTKGWIVRAGECVAREQVPFDQILTPPPPPPPPPIAPGTLAQR